MTFEYTTNYLKSAWKRFLKHKPFHNFLLTCIALVFVAIGLIFLVVEAQDSDDHAAEVAKVVGQAFVSVALIAVALSVTIFYSQKFYSESRPQKAPLAVLFTGLGLVVFGAIASIVFACIYDLKSNNHDLAEYIALILHTPTLVGVGLLIGIIFSKKMLKKTFLNIIMFVALLAFLGIQEITMIIAVGIAITKETANTGGYQAAFSGAGGDALFTLLILSFLLTLDNGLNKKQEKVAIVILIASTFFISVGSYALFFLVHGDKSFSIIVTIVIVIELLLSFVLCFLTPTFLKAVKDPKAAIRKG